MILRDIHLYPDLVEYPDDITVPFRNQSRSICNYIEQQLKKIKYKTKNFNRICIIGKTAPNKECFVNSCNVLSVGVSFDASKYKNYEMDRRNSLFFGMLLDGFAKIDESVAIPKTEILSYLEQFRSCGYKNEGIFKTKNIKKIGLKCDLYYKFTQSAFQLNLMIYKDEILFFDKEILKTEPNEIVFVPMFKDIKEKNGIVIVADAAGEALYQLDTSKLSLPNVVN